MNNEKSQGSNEHEGHFYKGLFFGLLLGVGLIWFLNSDSGKKLTRDLRKKIDEALAVEPGMEDLDYDTESENVEEQEKTSSKNPRRFFQKRSK